MLKSLSSRASIQIDITGILSFCLLAFLFSWLWWLIRFAPFSQAWLATGTPLQRADLGPLDVQIGMLGPILAAVVLRTVRGEGFHHFAGLKRSWKIYALAYLAPTLLGLAAGGFFLVTGLASFEPAGINLAVLPLVTLLATLTAFAEEAGWRGYLLPRLLPLGKDSASLITGLVWGVWHLPLLITGLSFPGQPVLLAAAVFLVATSLLSFLFTEIYLYSQASVAAVSLTHGALNSLSEIISPVHLVGASPLLAHPFGLVTALTVFIAVQAARNFRKRVSS